MKKLILIMMLSISVGMVLYAQLTPPSSTAIAAVRHYQIVNARSTFQLHKNVNEHIKDGWVPVGGVGYADQWYMQAMIK